MGGINGSPGSIYPSFNMQFNNNMLPNKKPMTAKEKKAAKLEQELAMNQSKEGTSVSKSTKKKDQDKKEKTAKTKKGKNARETPTEDSSTLGGGQNQFIGSDGINPDFDPTMAGMMYNNGSFPPTQGMMGSSMPFNVNQLQNIQGYSMGVPLPMHSGNMYMG